MYTLATRFQRFLSCLIDGVVASLLTELLSLFTGPTVVGQFYQDAAGNFYPVYQYNWLAIVVSSLATLILMLYFYRSSQSPGKAIMKLQVVDKETGQPVGMGRMLLREWLGKIVSTLVFGIGYLNILWDKNHQGWHDKIAKTVVIKKS